MPHHIHIPLYHSTVVKWNVDVSHLWSHLASLSSVWFCNRLHCDGCYFSLTACLLRCGGCYFSLAVCPASLWWLLLQSGCVSGFVVVAATSVWLRAGFVVVAATSVWLRAGFVVVIATSVWLCVRLRCSGCYFSLAACRLRCGGCYFSLAACRLRCGGCYFSLAACRLRCGGCYFSLAQGRSQDFYGGVLFAKIWTPTGDFK